MDGFYAIVALLSVILASVVSIYTIYDRRKNTVIEMQEIKSDIKHIKQAVEELREIPISIARHDVRIKALEQRVKTLEELSR